MLIVHVFVRVLPDQVEAFKTATIANAEASRKEPGVSFDVLQQKDDPTRFVLMETYRLPEGPANHKQTQHYQSWRDSVEPMMAEPRYSVRFGPVSIGVADAFTSPPGTSVPGHQA